MAEPKRPQTKKIGCAAATIVVGGALSGGIFLYTAWWSAGPSAPGDDALDIAIGVWLGSTFVIIVIVLLVFAILWLPEVVAWMRDR